ncbi:LysR family transcriptional regulator [Halalkalibacter sp. APA_J-10(15)]|uniref:LysR family transcriptional regulator n=1 Tax=unclassified Halalkalibacter TaxID=2893063 RepID=UPI001FF54B73|nr:LysR family transcriptional regulator [Halalkalibacter sp. APA_J-10(15)]MCK0472291.1 LysR family transcriptional regulator [Halalkalibacter sp. APA_J-10(15)]
MNLQQLKIFVLTAQLQKLKLVAERLNIKQPTVTFHLQRFEEECGIPLFKPSSLRTLKLTKAGESLYPLAMQITMLSEEIESTIAGFNERQRGTLRIGSTYTPATFLLPEQLVSFKSLHEEITLSLEVKPATIIMEKIKNYELDIGIISYGSIPGKHFTSRMIFKDDLKLLLHPNNPLAVKMNIEIDDLIKETFIMHEQGSTSRLLIDNWAHEHDITLSIVMEVSATETMKEAVKKNMGVAIVSERCSLREVEQGELVYKEIPYFQQDRFIHLIHQKNRVITPLIQDFIDTTIQYFRTTSHK